MAESSVDRLSEGCRCQFGIRSLLVTMLVVGPLAGWYGPLVAIQLRDYFAPEAAPQPRQTSEVEKRLQRITAQFDADREVLRTKHRVAEQQELLGPLYDATADEDGS